MPIDVTLKNLSKSPQSGTIQQMNLALPSLLHDGSTNLTMMRYIEEAHRQINRIIDGYQKPPVLEKQKRIFLNQIKEALSVLDGFFPDSYYAGSVCYQRFYQSVWHVIQQIDKDLKMNVNSISIELDELIFNMSQDKVNSLAGLLNLKHGAMFRSDLLSKIYAGENTPEARRFNHFFNHHCVMFLGGHNSLNFQVIPLRGGKIKILKLENRLGSARGAELELRRETNLAYFPQIFSRRVYPSDKEDGLSSSQLITTEYVRHGSIQKLSQSISKKKRRRVAAKIYFQMAKIFIDITEHECFFPDAKNSNWLVDQTLRLKISDAKSFVFIDQGRLYNGKYISNQYMRTIVSDSIAPPEMLKEKFPYNAHADRVHAYMLGKNIYHFLTKASHKNLRILGHTGATYPFSDNVFNDLYGREFKDLVIDLVKENPNQRLDIIKARQRLHSMHKIIVFQQQQPKLYKQLLERQEQPTEKPSAKINKMVGFLKKLDEFNQLHPQLKHFLLNEQKVLLGNDVPKILNEHTHAFYIKQKKRLIAVIEDNNEAQIKSILDGVKSRIEQVRAYAQNPLIVELQQYLDSLEARPTSKIKSFFKRSKSSLAEKIYQEVNELSLEKLMNLKKHQRDKKVLSIQSMLPKSIYFSLLHVESESAEESGPKIPPRKT